ncbi:hypothetical protein [Streptomyces sp. V3I7]|uniref:hypothetical protein n=1 Tax=Streptomyces sp. V3I7 TaxID=3042278 RepID=UPI002784C694|nr:hypothetical protein [Streptomyces sp. V3I7]MDQ0994801.1 hypothetical protein [Streptomyces sp. V3I7]
MDGQPALAGLGGEAVGGRAGLPFGGSGEEQHVEVAPRDQSVFAAVLRGVRGRDAPGTDPLQPRQ